MKLKTTFPGSFPGRKDGEMNTIRALYNGNLNPADKVGVDSELYLSAKERTYSAYKVFRSHLPAELISEFDSMMDKQFDLLTAGMEEGFIEGVSLGIRLIAEVYQS